MYIIKDDLLPIELSKRLEIKYKEAKYKFFWASNQFAKNPFFHWHIDILTSDSDNTDDISDQLYSKNDISDEIEVWELLQKEEILGPSSLLRCYVNAYTFGTEGLPHDDSKRDYEKTAIVYLNKWIPQWGGETVIFNGDQIEKSVLPQLGRVFVFPSNKIHAARSVAKNFQGLRSVLVFKTRSNNAPIISPEISEHKKFLKEIGTQELKHGNNQTLFQHLVKTYELLKEWGVPEHIRFAGLFHSLYGTSFYNPNILIEREKIKELIGKKAEFLIWLFCNIDRRKVDLEFNVNTTLPLRNSFAEISLTMEEIMDLATLAKANRQAHD